MKKIILALIMVAPLLTTAQDVVKLVPEKFNEYALNYYLPHTIADMEFVATKTTRKAGPYYKYAQKYLGTAEAITEDSESWAIERVCIIPRGIANTTERYQLTFKAGQNPYIYVGEEGVIYSINTTPTIDTLSCAPVLPDEMSNVDVKKVYSEELLMSGSVAKMAEVAAKQIYRIRESRMNLLTGEVDKMPADGDSFKLIIAQLDEQEAALTALFLGTTSVERHVKHVEYKPEGDVDKGILFRFSDFLGFVDAEDLSGAPVYLDVKVLEKGEYPVDEKGIVKRVPKGALAYNIPGKVELSISYEGRNYARGEMMVAQLGVVYGLDSNLFSNKKSPANAVFSPTTGALLSIGVVE